MNKLAAINPAHHQLEGNGFDMAKTTAKICFQSVWIGQQIQTPRRDTSNPSVSAGLGEDLSQCNSTIVQVSKIQPQ